MPAPLAARAAPARLGPLPAGSGTADPWRASRALTRVASVLSLENGSMDVRPRGDQPDKDVGEPVALVTGAMPMTGNRVGAENV